MVRNYLKNNTLINIQVSNGSQNKLCTEVNVLSNETWFNTFEKTIEFLYKKESNYQTILNEVIYRWVNNHLNDPQKNPKSYRIEKMLDN